MAELAPIERDGTPFPRPLAEFSRTFRVDHGYSGGLITARNYRHQQTDNNSKQETDNSSG